MWLGCLNLGLESWREGASAPWALPFVRSTREDGARLGSRAGDPHTRTAWSYEAILAIPVRA